MSKRKTSYTLRSSVNKKKNRGFTLPGYNNLGPFNDPDIPTSKSDYEALIHDKKYSTLGKRAYWTFNQADQDFLDNIDQEEDIGAKIAKKVFKGKKKLAELGILPSDPIQTNIDKDKGLELALSTNGAITRSRAKRLRQQKLTERFQKRKERQEKNKRKSPKELTYRGPLSNLQEDTQVPISNMVDGKGSGTTAGLSETPIDKVVDVERGVANYQFASLPFNGIWFGEEANIISNDFGFRMTSPYDCVISTVKKDTNTGTGTQSDITMKTDATDTTANSAAWFDFYAGIYKYYSVVSCKWKILFENLSNEPLWLHQMYITDTSPLELASNIDMMNWPDCKSYFIDSYAKFCDTNGVKSAQLASGWQTEGDTVSTTSNFLTGESVASKGSNILQLSGQYSPGDCHRDIRLDADVENWTTVDTNPKLPERLFFRVKSESAAQRAASNDTTNYGRRQKYKYTIQLEYLVEFKELRDGLKWPTFNQPLKVTIAENLTTSGTTDEQS